jgi:hypothetical protein
MARQIQNAGQQSRASLNTAVWLCGIFLFALFTLASSAPVSNPAALFKASGAPSGAAPKHPFAGRSRFVTIAPGLLKKTGPSALSFNLFDDVVLDGTKEKTEDSQGRENWFGKVVGKKMSSAVFTVGPDNSVAGSVRTLEKIYEIMPVRGAVHVVWEIDPLLFPREKAPKKAPGFANRNTAETAPALVAR